MIDRVGREAIGLGRKTARGRRTGRLARRVEVENLEGRALMTAAIAPIANVNSVQYEGVQVPVTAQTSHAQTYTVTSDNPSIKATVAQGKFLTVGVTHTASGAGDVNINGTMTFQLFDDLTPLTTSKIESLVNGTATGLAQNVTIGSDYYVGKIFHRVASGFPGTTDYIVQGGSLNGDGTGQVFAQPFADEFLSQLAFTGTGQLAMANTISDTNDSQFFITTGSPTFLNYHQTIFGQIVSGTDILQQMTQVTKGTDGTTPVNPITITSATLADTNPNGVIHVDTTLAPASATGNVTVTATDVTDGSTASQTFQVAVAPPSTTPNRPFLGPVDSTYTVAQGQTAKIQLNAISTTPNDPLTYTVQGGVTTSGSTNSFSSVQNVQSATVDSNGVVTVVPTSGFTGSISLLVGVRDATNRNGSGALESPFNYDTQAITLNVTSSTTPTSIRPLAQSTTVSASANGPNTIQLSGTNPNTTNNTQALRYAITTPPTNGTITSFNPATGALVYTPRTGYQGPDAFQYVVSDPNTQLASYATSVNINVAVATQSTGAVRFLANDGTSNTANPGVLVVTPLPRTDGGTNVIDANVINGNVVVTVNGVNDSLQPSLGNVDRLVIYGAKASDRITVSPAVTSIATLDGGHGGKNVIQAGGGQTREHGWYGQNTLIQGSSNNYQLGRRGHVKFVKGTGSSDVIFAGEPARIRKYLFKNRVLPVPATGTFYKFGRNGKTLVEAANPYRSVRNSTASDTSTGSTSTSS